MTFIVKGEPKGKARPRFARGRAYTPQTTVDYEKEIKARFLECGGKFSHADKFTVDVIACFGVPKSAPKKKVKDMLAYQIMPTKRPDIDNILKVVLDALNGVAYYDDSQVVRVVGTKAYNKEPFLQISIEEGCVYE